MDDLIFLSSFVPPHYHAFYQELQIDSDRESEDSEGDQSEDSDCDQSDKDSEESDSEP